MKKGLNIGLICLFALVLSLSMISAFSFSELWENTVGKFWKKITGKFINIPSPTYYSPPPPINYPTTSTPTVNPVCGTNEVYNSDTGLCECDTGYELVDNVCTEIPVCDPVCEEGYECVDGSCAEEVIVCDPECGENEICNEGVCECDTGYELIEEVCTEILVCDPACEEGFECVDGSCVEEVIVCDPECGENEVCTVGVCECDTGYELIDEVCTEAPVCDDGILEYPEQCENPGVGRCGEDCMIDLSQIRFFNKLNFSRTNIEGKYNYEFNYNDRNNTDSTGIVDDEDEVYIKIENNNEIIDFSNIDTSLIDNQNRFGFSIDNLQLTEGATEELTIIYNTVICAIDSDIFYDDSELDILIDSCEENENGIIWNSQFGNKCNSETIEFGKDRGGNELEGYTCEKVGDKAILKGFIHTTVVSYTPEDELNETDSNDTTEDLNDTSDSTDTINITDSTETSDTTNYYDYQSDDSTQDDFTSTEDQLDSEISDEDEEGEGDEEEEDEEGEEGEDGEGVSSVFLVIIVIVFVVGGIIVKILINYTNKKADKMVEEEFPGDANQPQQGSGGIPPPGSPPAGGQIQISINSPPNQQQNVSTSQNTAPQPPQNKNNPD